MQLLIICISSQYAIHGVQCEAGYQSLLLVCGGRQMHRMHPPLKWVKVFRGWIEPQSCTWQTCAIMHSKWCPRRVLTKWCTFSGKLFTSGSVCESRYNKWSSYVFEQNDHCKTQSSRRYPKLSRACLSVRIRIPGERIRIIGTWGNFF